MIPRTLSRIQIDLLIDHGSRHVPVEVKSGQTVAADFFRVDAVRGDALDGLVARADGPKRLQRLGYSAGTSRRSSPKAWSSPAAQRSAGMVARVSRVR